MSVRESVNGSGIILGSISSASLTAASSRTVLFASFNFFNHLTLLTMSNPLQRKAPQELVRKIGCRVKCAGVVLVHSTL